MDSIEGSLIFLCVYKTTKQVHIEDELTNAKDFSKLYNTI